MEIDLDTFLVIVYCIVDDLYKELVGVRGSKGVGRKSLMSDSEVLTLVLLCQWEQRRSEREFLRWAGKSLGGYFPVILSQAEYNRRVRGLVEVLSTLGSRVMERVSEELGLGASYEVVDGTGVPLMRRSRGQKHKLFGDEAAIGYGGSDREWFYGVRLLVVVGDGGLITGFVVGSARTEERWLAEGVFRWRKDRGATEPKAQELEEKLGRSRCTGKEAPRVGPSGPIHGPLTVGMQDGRYYLADRGLRGAAWGKHWFEDYGARLITEADYSRLEGEKELKRQHRSKRQIVETVIGVLVDIFGLKFPRARTYLGLICRLSAKVAAFNLAVAINYMFGRPTFAIFNPIH